MLLHLFTVFSKRLYCFLYWTFYGVVCGALEVAGNLNVTSDHLLDYNNDPRSQRIYLGITAVTLWSVLLILDVSDMFRYAPLLFNGVLIAGTMGKFNV